MTDKTYPCDFQHVSTTEWKWYPDGTPDDEKYYKENLEDYDPNEDHECGICEKPLPGRFLCCSKKCMDALNELIGGEDE